MNWFTTNSSN